MPMQLYLYNYENADNIEEVLSWRPTEKQWWITGFNPDYVGNVDVSKEILVGCVDFTGHEGLYEGFAKEYTSDSELSKYVILDDDRKLAWIHWCEDGLIK